MIIRYAAPQEKRQTRGQFQITDTICRTRGHTCRVSLYAEQKLGAGQYSFKSSLNSCFKVAFTSAGFVNAQQRSYIFIPHGPAIRAACQRRENLSGARLLVCSASGAADKNLLPGGCVSYACDVIGPGNDDIVDVGVAALILNQLELSQRGLEYTFGYGVLTQESYGNQPLARLRTEAHFQGLLSAAVLVCLACAISYFARL